MSIPRNISSDSSSLAPSVQDLEQLRLEAVTVSVGFDDLLDITLTTNHPHLDTMVVVTSHEDRKTQQGAAKHGAICVTTDLFSKNGRKFNKGAAINAGMSHFQYHGWRLHLDSDITLPDNFRRILFNHTHLERSCLYGADRFDVIGKGQIEQLPELFGRFPQHRLRCLMDPTHDRNLVAPAGARLIGNLDGYTPLGYFQLWHSSCQKSYPYSLGDAAHDDVMFARLWPVSARRLLPSVAVYHLCPSTPQWGENWDGNRKQERID